MTATTGQTKAPAAVAAVTERIVRNGEIELAVFEQGNRDGDTIVLVHGWPDTHHLWTDVVALLAGRFHVVTYDTRGHGGSTNPKGWQPFGLAELAGDFFAVAAAVSPHKPVHVLAHDWGSVQLWEAVCEPGAEERIASFTSVSGPNLDHVGLQLKNALAHPTPRNLAGPMRQLAASSYTFFFQTPVLPRVAFTLGVNERVWKRFLSTTEGTPPANVHLADTLRKDMVSGLRIYRANIFPKLRNATARHTTVPVQLIVDKRDYAVRPVCYDTTASYTDRLWRTDIDAGHWSPFSHPQVLAKATTDLVDHLNGAEPSRELRRSAVGPEREEFGDALVVITGGGSGIGRETALAFARKGAEIIICDRNLASAKETSALVAEVGAEAHAYEVNVADETAVQAFADTVFAKHGVPDILVNNAGVGQAGRFFDTPSAEFKRVLDINLYGVVHGCRAFGPRMAARGLGGQIVNLSSLAAWSPQQNFSAYSTSKSAVAMFSDCLRAELVASGIGVSTIHPGIVHTNIVATTAFAGVSAEEEARKQARYDKLYRMRRYTPDKVANHIVDAVRKNKDVVPVTPESHQGYLAYRFTPGLMRRFAARGSLIK